MILCNWTALPIKMQNEEVRKYYDILQKNKGDLILKFIFDRSMALLLLVLLAPVFLGIAIWIKQESKGDVFFRQVRVTRYGKNFRIFKFRTMTQGAELNGTQLTVQNDVRITKVGKKIRAYRLDELPQLINVLKGEMSFVGTRPEVPKYVEAYSKEMLATLLLPAGVTSSASIKYKDEADTLNQGDKIDEIYITKILPKKMEYNLCELRNTSFLYNLTVMLKTVEAIF